MNDIELPALHGLDPLGFLAALGVVRLLHEYHDPRTTLRWHQRDGVAVIGSELDGIDQLVEALRMVVSGIAEDATLPGVDGEFPWRGGQTGGDPMRVDRAQLRTLHDQVAAGGLGREAVRWLAALVTDLGVDERGRVLLSPWMAPSGKQTIETFVSKSLEAMRARPERMQEALMAWRRVARFSGEYLDHRVLNDAASDPSGSSLEAGVPGATWLAIMALPMLRISSVRVRGRDRTSGTLWRRVASGQVAIWPLWSEALRVPAIRVLLEHPDLLPGLEGHGQVARGGPAVNDVSRWEAHRRRLDALGVFALGAARRRQLRGRNFAGVLVPVPEGELTSLLGLT